MFTRHGIFFRDTQNKDVADVLIMGVPFDGTVSGRPGTRYGPAAMRAATLNLEDYSPYLERDISDVNLYDHGDIELPVGDTPQCIEVIEEEFRNLYQAGKKHIVLGGEHLVSYPIIKVMKEVSGDDFFVVHMDAHADMREDYLGVELSHASVMKRITDLIGEENVAVLGVRSGTREEWGYLRSHPNFFGGASKRPLEDFIPFAQKKLNGKKVYITVDLDVFDPGIMPGTGTPQPGGIGFPDFIKILKAIPEESVIGGDIVELSPGLDSSGISDFLAATVLREMILLIGGKV